MINNITNKSINTQRDSNLELFRIIVMLSIIAHHYVVNSGLLDPGGVVYSNLLSPKSLFLLIFGAWGKVGINCFVMITGYFMCCSNISLRKFLKMLFEIMFYRIVIYMIFFAVGYEPFALRSFREAIIPVTGIATNFDSCFLLFYLCIPFINILIHHLSEKQHILLLLLVGFMYVFLGTFHRVTFNYVTWFICLFFISSYLRLYPKKCFERTTFWGILTIVFLAVSCASIIGIVWIRVTYNYNLNPYMFLTDSNTFLAVALGISAFMFFKNIQLSYIKIINYMASSTFGVLLIHANSGTMRRWLWRDLLNNIGHYNLSWMPLHAIGSVIGVFIVCTCIDKIRIKLIETPFFRWWDRNNSRFKEKYTAFKQGNIQRGI